MLGTLNKYENRGLESLDKFLKGINMLHDADGIWSRFFKQKHI